MDSKIVVPVEILGVKKGTYEGHDYTTLTVRSNGDVIVKMNGVGAFDFAPFKDKGVVSVLCELRDKQGYLSLRATGVEVKK